jgi:4-oxalocrotonate tautomerase family enzyme
MPYANIQLTSKGVTREEKKRWIAGVTKQLTEAFGKNPKQTEKETVNNHSALTPSITSQVIAASSIRSIPDDFQ